jgi:nucleoside-diphosphate kinase
VELTFTMIKPDGVEENNIGNILAKIEAAGFSILGMKMVRFTKSQAQAFYEVHKERPFYNDLVNYITRGRVVVMALEKENAVADFRTLIGATNPADAAEGTIRKLYAKSIEENAIHGSDSVENGLREVAFFFSESELIANR